jgi:DNA-binding GntR family transcriptional regulator
MLTWLPVPAKVLTFGQFIKKPYVAYRTGVSRVPVSEALRTDHV